MLHLLRAPLMRIQVDQCGSVRTGPITTNSFVNDAGFQPVNHAFLCLDPSGRFVSPQIVNFPASHSQHTYGESSGALENRPAAFSTPSPDLNIASSTNPFQSHGFSKDDVSYMDLGDCIHRCRNCDALFWYGERLKNSNYSRDPEYHLCCAGGNMYLRPSPAPSEIIRQLLTNAHFMEYIRAYNQMFAMTSFGAKVDDSVNKAKGPYIFKVSGHIYHWIGSLCPEQGDPPRFLQLYIYDTYAETTNRLATFGGHNAGQLSSDIVDSLIRVLDEHNGLVRLFRTARDRCAATEIPAFKIRLFNRGGERGYELPTSDVLGAIVFEDGPKCRTDFDVIIELKGGPPQRVSKLHQSYMSLQFPLLFVFGEPGYFSNLVSNPRGCRGRGRKVSINAFYKYQLHPRFNEFGLLFRAGRLFQQYVVAAFCAIEQCRLDFVRKRQHDLRSDYLAGLYDAVSRGDREGVQAGSIVILPRTFTGSPRYMYSHYLDALAICKSLGNPQYFITFTCNVKWPEIKRYMSQLPRLTPADRADIVCRVFQQKVDDFIKFIKFEKPFGHVIAFLYTIEFQKRGLPHCHTLLWIESVAKIQQPSQIDAYISAELPDPFEDPNAYKVVTELMMHGPCGMANPGASCTENGVCTKRFPKTYTDKTFIDANGHTHYQRRQTGIHVMKGEARLDNCNVVPYNRQLCLAFHAHINIEYRGRSMLIK